MRVRWYKGYIWTNLMGRFMKGFLVFLKWYFGYICGDDSDGEEIFEGIILYFKRFLMFCGLKVYEYYLVSGYCYFCFCFFIIMSEYLFSLEIN